MKAVSQAMATFLSGENISMCRLLKITRADGSVYRFTDLDNDLPYVDSAPGYIQGTPQEEWLAQSSAASPWWALVDDAMTYDSYDYGVNAAFGYYAASGPWNASQLFAGYSGANAVFLGTPRPFRGLTFETICSIHYDTLSWYGGAQGSLLIGLAADQTWSANFIGFSAVKSASQVWGNWQLIRDNGGGEQTIDSGVPVGDYSGPGAGVTVILTSVDAPSGGSAVYHGTIPGGASNYYVFDSQPTYFLVSGFPNPANNGVFACTASTATTLTLTNPSAVAQSGANATGFLGGVRTTLSFSVNDAGTLVTWYINGVAVGTATTGIPTVNLALANNFDSYAFGGSLYYRVESLALGISTGNGIYLSGLTDGDGNTADSGPGAGLTFSAVEIKADGSANNCSVTGFLSDSGINEHDIEAHLYDGATFELRAVNWADTTMGDLKLLSGTIGDITTKNGMYTMELRGWTQKLSTQVGSCYGPNCRAELFGGGVEGIDPTNHWKCRLNRADWVQNGTVGSIPDLITIVPTEAGSPPAADLFMVGSSTPTDVAPAGWFDQGVITFTSGVLEGYSFEIAIWDGAVMQLYAAQPMPFAPAPGDTFEIEPGCDKTPVTCHTKFVNIINFAGEANIPGLNVIGAVSRPQVPN